MTRTIAAIAMLATTGLWGCGGDSPSGPQAGSTEIHATTSLQFTPQERTIEAGGTITWNFGAVGHSVQFDQVAGRPVDITGPVANQSIARTFPQVGVFPFGCTIHPAMRGSVRVVAQGSPPPPPPPPPPPSPYY